MSKKQCEELESSRALHEIFFDFIEFLIVKGINKELLREMEEAFK